MLCPVIQHSEDLGAVISLDITHRRTASTGPAIHGRPPACLMQIAPGLTSGTGHGSPALCLRGYHGLMQDCFAGSVSRRWGVSAMLQVFPPCRLDPDSGNRITDTKCRVNVPAGYFGHCLVGKKFRCGSLKRQEAFMGLLAGNFGAYFGAYCPDKHQNFTMFILTRM